MTKSLLPSKTASAVNAPKPERGTKPPSTKSKTSWKLHRRRTHLALRRSEPHPAAADNQATHERISPVVIGDKYGPRIRVRGVRDPFYREADRFLGKARPAPPHSAEVAEPALAGHKKTQASNSQGLGSHEERMAEGEGFEPSMDVNRP